MKEVGQKKVYIGTPLAVQWLGLHASTARGTGSIPAQRTKILHAVQCSQKKKKKSLCSIILFIGKARKCKLFHSDSIPNAWDGSRGRERWRDGKELKEPFGRWTDSSLS